MQYFDTKERPIEQEADGPMTRNMGGKMSDDTLNVDALQVYWNWLENANQQQCRLYCVNGFVSLNLQLTC